MHMTPLSIQDLMLLDISKSGGDCVSTIYFHVQNVWHLFQVDPITWFLDLPKVRTIVNAFELECLTYVFFYP